MRPGRLVPYPPTHTRTHRPTCTPTHPLTPPTHPPTRSHHPPTHPLTPPTHPLTPPTRSHHPTHPLTHPPRACMQVHPSGQGGAGDGRRWLHAGRPPCIRAGHASAGEWGGGACVRTHPGAACWATRGWNSVCARIGASPRRCCCSAPPPPAAVTTTPPPPRHWRAVLGGVVLPPGGAARAAAGAAQHGCAGQRGHHGSLPLQVHTHLWRAHEARSPCCCQAARASPVLPSLNPPHPPAPRLLLAASWRWPGRAPTQSTSHTACSSRPLPYSSPSSASASCWKARPRGEPARCGAPPPSPPPRLFSAPPPPTPAPARPPLPPPLPYRR